MRLKELKEKRNTLIGFDPENEKECLEAVKQNSIALTYIANQTKQKKYVELLFY